MQFLHASLAIRYLGFCLVQVGQHFHRVHLFQKWVSVSLNMQSLHASLAHSLDPHPGLSRFLKNMGNQIGPHAACSATFNRCKNKNTQTGRLMPKKKEF